MSKCFILLLEGASELSLDDGEGDIEASSTKQGLFEDGLVS